MQRLARAVCLPLFFSVPFLAIAETQELIKKENLSLKDCIEIALQRNQMMQISNEAVAIAEAQYQQAMSAYWPNISVDVDATRADEDRTFTGRTSAKIPPAISGFLGGQKELPVDLNVKLFDRDLLTASINLTYPIFTGGKRPAIIKQAEKGVKISEVGQHKTQMELVRDVKKYYYGAQFAANMEQLAHDTLERFQSVEDLTERLYQGKSMKVKKTDYLRTRTTTAITRSMLNEANYARELAHQALVNAMGLDWSAEITLAKDEQAVEFNPELVNLIETAHEFNPEIQQLKLALEASDYKITEARSGYFPVIGFQASSYKMWNEFDGGLINNANREGWTIGVGMKWNLFDGFQTTGRVNQAQAQQRQLQSQKILLDQATALQIKQQFLRLKSSHKQVKDTQDAVNFASENRKLNMRAYQEDLVETKDVIEAQIVETYAEGSYYRSKQELEVALATLEFLVGKNIQGLDQ